MGNVIDRAPGGATNANHDGGGASGESAQRCSTWPRITAAPSSQATSRSGWRRSTTGPRGSSQPESGAPRLSPNAPCHGSPGAAVSQSSSLTMLSCAPDASSKSMRQRNDGAVIASPANASTTCSPAGSVSGTSSDTDPAAPTQVRTRAGSFNVMRRRKRRAPAAPR
jgi:hypothetical protein